MSGSAPGRAVRTLCPFEVRQKLMTEVAEHLVTSTGVGQPSRAEATPHSDQDLQYRGSVGSELCPVLVRSA